MPTGSSMTKEIVLASSVVTETLTIGNKVVNEIISEIKNEPNKLLSASAVYSAFRNIRKVVDALDPANDVFRDKSVITEPLIDPRFLATDGWYATGYRFQSGKAVLIDKSVHSPYINLPANVFLKSGHYLLKVSVEKLEHAMLSLVGANNELLYVIDEPGTYYIEVPVDNSVSSNTFNLVTSNNSEISTVIIDYLGIHFIAERFHHYLHTKLGEFLGTETSNLATRAYVNVLLNDLNDTIQTQLANLLDIVDEHTTNVDNPHNTTYEHTGAAPVLHSHNPQDINAAHEHHSHTLSALGAAAELHTHSQYVERQELSSIIDDTMLVTLSKVPSVRPLTILKAPTGILPYGLDGENIQTKTQILIPSLFNHDSEHLYDEEAGCIASSMIPVNDSKLSKLLELGSEDYVYFSTTTLGSIHYSFHTKRKISGYTIHFVPEVSRLKEWDFYTNYNTFHHRGVVHNPESPFMVNMLPEPIEMTSFTLNIKEIEKNVDASTVWGIRLELHFVDVVENGFRVDFNDVRLSIPNSTSNLVLDIDHTTTIVPDTHIEDVPLYVYLALNNNNSPYVNYTTIAPEYSMTRRGTNITKYLVDAEYSSVDGSYSHPVTGKLIPNRTINSLLDIFSPENTETVRINDSTVTLQLILPEPLVLCGYKLEFNLTDVVPTEWSLEIKAVVNDTIQDIIIDSSKSFAGNMIINPYGDTNVYRVDLPHYVISELKLNLKNNINSIIDILKFVPYFSKDWYCIPDNTMYTLLTPSNRIYIGTAEYMDTGTNTGYIVNNSVLGSLTTLVLNELHPCSEFELYAIHNPFLTKQVSVSVNAISVGGESGGGVPSAVVEEIDTNTIYIRTFSEHRFVVDIIRNW